MIKSIGFYDEDSATAPVHGLQLKDKRYDPVVAAGLAAVDRAMQGHALDDAERTAIIGITDGGCSVHVARVVDGIAADKPRQAFFVRAGAQTIATYAAMALGTHGPAMTFSSIPEITTAHDKWMPIRVLLAMTPPAGPGSCSS